jgi:hypothetical protein
VKCYRRAAASDFLIVFMSSHLLLSRRCLLAAAAVSVAAPKLSFAAMSAPLSSPSWLSPLAQRCAKAYSQSALNVLPAQCKAVMADTQRSMASSMSQLRGQPAAVRFELQRELRRFDTLLAAAPARKVLLAVSHQSNVLQETVERDAQPQAFHALATLSQRMAKHYFLLAWGVDQADARMQLFLDQRAFALALQAAQQQQQLSPLSVSERRALELTQAQWAFYEAALKAPPISDKQQQVASASERMWALLWPLSA